MNIDLTKEHVDIKLKYSQKAYEILAIMLYMFKNNYYLSQGNSCEINGTFLEFIKITKDIYKNEYGYFTSEISNNNNYTFKVFNNLSSNDSRIQINITYPIGNEIDSILIKTDINTKEVILIDKNNKTEYNREEKDRYDIQKIENILNKHIKKLKFFEENVNEIFTFIHKFLYNHPYNTNIFGEKNAITTKNRFLIFNMTSIYKFKKYMNNILTYKKSYKEINDLINCISNDMVEGKTYKLGLLSFIKRNNNMFAIYILNNYITNIYLTKNLDENALFLILTLLNVDGGVNKLKAIIYKNRILTE